MQREAFAQGLKHLVIVCRDESTAEFQQDRVRAYWEILQTIPDEMWVEGIKKLAATWHGSSFPLPAHFGEACIAGVRFGEEMDPYTRLKKKVADPGWSASRRSRLCEKVPGRSLSLLQSSQHPIVANKYHSEIWA